MNQQKDTLVVKTITTLESNSCFFFLVPTGFIVFYVVYILVVIFGHYIYQRWKRNSAVRVEIKPSDSGSGMLMLHVFQLLIIPLRMDHIIMSYFFTRQILMETFWRHMAVLGQKNY